MPETKYDILTINTDVLVKMIEATKEVLVALILEWDAPEGSDLHVLIGAGDKVIEDIKRAAKVRDQGARA